jgi:probable phosphoglycerate mutase
MNPAHAGEFDGVILAAGRSQRAGAFKPALVAAGKPLLIHAVESLEPRCRRVIVVVGHNRDEAAGLLAGRSAVAVVHNPRHDEGMFGSVQAGVRAVDPSREGFFVLPVDCPLVLPGVFSALVEAFRAHTAALPIVPAHDGRGGHPVLVPIALREVILAADMSATLRQILARAGALRVPVASPSVLTDLDTPADLERFRADLGRP